MSKNKVVKIIKWLALVMVILIAGLLVKDYLKTRNDLRSLEKSLGNAGDIQRIERKVEKYIDIPSDETPELRIVNDVDILEGQKFFSKAKKGDAVLVYIRYGRGVLYRESEDKIIEYSPVNYTE